LEKKARTPGLRRSSPGQKSIFSWFC
jgi:Transcription elongation factor